MNNNNNRFNFLKFQQTNQKFYREGNYLINNTK